MNNQQIIRFIVLFMLVFFFIKEQAFAKEIDITTAKNVALNVYTERSESQSSFITVSELIEEKEKGVIVFYILKYSEKGFAIISADDRVRPILGYSFESYYDDNDLAPAFEYYILERLKKQIYTFIQHDLPDKSETLYEWSKYGKDPNSFQPESIKNFVPLLTSIWHQRWPYNGLCPIDTNSCNSCNDHVVVGCVATAMAQVLNYWQHPWHGTGSYSYSLDDHPEYGVLTADFGNTIYNFDNMPDTANNYSEDLAELNYHCGVSVNMNYGPGSSGAWGWTDDDDVCDALKNYFYFDNAADGIRRSSFPTTWIDKMKQSLDASRPVIYGAEDNQEDVGHAWVLDAYTTGDMFHCNWGWGGTYNGWYSIDDFYIDDTSNILSVSSYTFDTYETACINVFPKTAHVNETYTTAGSPYYLNFDYYVDPGDQLIIEPGVEIIFSGRYKIDVRGKLDAIGTVNDSIFIKAENPEIGMKGIRFTDLNNYSADSSKLQYCSFNYGRGERTVVNSLGGIKGGAIYSENSSKVLISNCLIRNSKAGYGGGIACYDSSNVRIKNCVVRNDSATMGGGIYLSTSNAILSNNIFYDNYAESNGGGTYCRFSDPLFYQDTIRNNYAGFGGGMGFSNSWAILDEVMLFNNEARVDAGGIYSGESNLDLNKMHIYNNVAGDIGGGCLSYWNSDFNMNETLIYNNEASVGAAIAVVSAHPSIVKSTITNNIAEIDGEAIHIEDGGISIENSIIWGNTPEQIDTSGTCTVNLSYSVIEGGLWQGTGVVYDDPQFQGSKSQIFSLSWGDFPIPDGNKSPAIDSGNPSSPTDPDGTRADMGALPFEQLFTSIPGGSINGTLTCLNSPYYVQGDLEIEVTEELIIEPCVTLIFQGDYHLEVRGRLLAEGTETDKITFAPADTLVGWQGIRFINTQSNGLDSSRLVHCRLTFGNADGWSSNNKRGGAAFFSNASNVFINHCLFNKNMASNQGGAIYITGTNSPVITNCTFENNYAPTGGALLGLYTNLTLKNNLFQNNNANNGGAIYCHTSNFTFEGNTIRNNRAEKLGGGIYFEVGGTHTFDPINKNNIYLNYAAAAGLDIYSTESGSSKTIVVDTFTVQNPNKHFVWPLNKFTFSIDNHIIDQVDGDLWVSMTGDDENSGTSEAEPLKTMYMACLKIMADETNPHTIYLADGTYSEGATGEIFPINWRSYVSMKGESIDETIIYGEDKNQLLFCYDDSGFSIDSLTFEGGYGIYGGAIRLENESSPAISHIEVKNNFALEDGGGIFCGKYCSPYITDINVHHNSCDVDGGGIRCYNYSNATIINSMIYENFALYRGGGISVYFYSDVNMDSLIVSSNTAVHGGGLYISWSSDVKVKNTLIESNDALSHVMGYFGSGGGIWMSSRTDLENVEIQFNHADNDGGGIHSQGQNPGISYNCLIDHNTSKQGGGLYLSGGNQKYYNTIISNNHSTDGYGGGIYLNGGNPEFINLTITGNVVYSSGYYTYYGGALYNYNSNPVFKSSILWNNSPNEIEIGSGTVTAEYCNIDGGYSGAGNINSDPLFETTVNGILDISASSPCINAGNPDTTGLNLPSFDFARNYRISNNIIDMGAYEFQFNLGVELDITLFLEGPFNGTDMNSGINENIPLSQPYNISPWNYDGSEVVTTIPNPQVVDWVLVELREAAEASIATPSTSIARQAAFLMSDGSIRGLDGSSYENFNDLTITESLFVVIWHRNHLGVMSALPVEKTGELYTYDFTSGILKAYNSGHKDLGGIYGMFAADADGNGTIELPDKSDFWETEAGNTGYLNGDFNLDKHIDNIDKNDFWIENNETSSQIPN